MIDGLITLGGIATVAFTVTYAATIGVVLAMRHTRRPPNG